MSKMKADTVQIPAQVINSTSNALSEPQQANSKLNSGVFNYIRRLERRTAELEEKYSTLRRDVNRIEKAQSRAKIDAPPMPAEPATIAAPAAGDVGLDLLFGGK